MSVRFQGFRTGSQVTMDAVTTSAWGQAVSATPIFDVAASSGVTATISETRSPFQTAPESIGFDVATTGFDTNTASSGHDVTFNDKQVYWRCRSHPYGFAAPTQVLALDTADGGNRKAAGLGIGRIWEHVAQEPGNYIYDVVVYEPSSGKYAKDTLTLTVDSADDEFPTTQTIFVSTTGVYTNAPTGAQTTTSIDSAITTMMAAESTKHRVMLERGQTHTMTSRPDIMPSASATVSSFWLVAREGSGADPIVVDGTTGGDFITENAHNLPTTEISAECVMSGITFQGQFDPTDGTGDQRIFLRANIDQRSGNYILINKCQVIGFDRMITAPDSGSLQPNRRITVCDTKTTDWASNGFFGANGSQIAFLGCEFAQNTAAIFSLSAGANGVPLSPVPTTSGWCARVTTPSRFVFQSCDFYAGQGWSNWGTQPAAQSALRIFASVGSAWVPNVMTYCAVEGGRFGVYYRPTNGGDARQPCNGLFEKNFVIGNFQSTRVMEVGKGGLTIRDCQFVSAGDKGGASEGGLDVTPVAGVSMNGGGSNLNSNNTIPVNIERITVINDSTTNMTNDEFINEIGLTVNTSGMLFYEPNTGSPDTADGPFTTVQGFTPRFPGVVSNSFVLDTTQATPATAGLIYTKSGGASTKPDYSVPA